MRPKKLIEIRAAVAWSFCAFGVVILLLTLVLWLASISSATHHINAERERNARHSCLDQNKRNNDVIEAIDATIAEIPEGPKRVAAEKSREPLIFIITAAVPHRDCKRVVEELRIGEK